MDTKLYILCMLLGLLGVAFHILAIKAPAVKKRTEAANLPFKLINYLKDDILAISASIITVVIAVFLLDEIIGYNPSFIRYVKFGFVFVGYTGSSLLISILGKFDKGVRDVVDVKTNKADSI